MQNAFNPQNLPLVEILVSDPAAPYTIVQIVAAAPQGAKGYRVTFLACSDFAYESPTGEPKRWSPENVAELVERESWGGRFLTRAIRCDRETWIDAQVGDLNGYAAERSLAAPILRNPDWLDVHARD